MMRRYLLPVLWVCAFVLAACSAVAPTLRGGDAGRAPWDLGAPHGASVAVAARPTRDFRTEQATGSIPATVGDVATYLFELRRTSDNSVAGSFTSPQPTARFAGVPDGTYYLRADARNALTQSLVEGGAQNSLNTVTVATPSVLYSAGGALDVMLNLRNGQGMVLGVNITAPYTGGFVTSLLALPNGPATTYPSTVSSLEFRNALDGTYRAWAMAHDGAGIATPGMVSGFATVSGNATGLSGKLDVVVGATVAPMAGAGVGDGGPAAASGMVSSPRGLCFAANGNLLIADQQNHRVRLIAAANGTFFGQAMQSGRIYTVSGTGVLGYSGDGSSARQAQLNAPSGVAQDAAGNLYIADRDNHRIRVVCQTPGTYFGVPMVAGRIYAIVGTGTGGFNGDNIAAGTAQVNQPFGLTIDSFGNLYIAELLGHRIRMVCQAAGTYFGQAMVAGNIYTVAGTGTSAFSADGSSATSSAIASPSGVVVDSSGNVVFCDVGSQRVRLVPKVTGTYYGGLRTAGFLYTIAGTGSVGNGGSGGLATATAMSNPVAVAIHPGNSDIYIVDSANNKIRRRSTAGADGLTADNLYTIAGTTAGFSGDGGSATAAQLNQPFGVAVDGTGNCVVADKNNQCIRVIAGLTGTFLGQPVTAGNIDRVTGNGGTVWAGEDCPAKEARFASVAAVTMDNGGHLLLAEENTHTIRIVANATGTFYGKAMTAGNVYLLAGQPGTPGTANGTGSTAQFNVPTGVSCDTVGNVYVADSANNLIRRIDGSGAVTTLVSGLSQPMDVVCNSVGQLYISEFGLNRIAKAPSSGGAAASFVTGLTTPNGLAVDGQGNVYIAVTGDHTVVRADPAGSTTVVAGVAGTPGNANDGGLATTATLSSPKKLAWRGGFLYVATPLANRVRMMAPDGKLYRIAGDGSTTPPADGALAAGTGLPGPEALAIDQSGRFVVVSRNPAGQSVVFQIR
jgi:sugar lactone lactonase YvrE